MAWVAGADGCRAGWFWAARQLESGALRCGIAASATELLTQPPGLDVLAIDIPIGLPDAGPRECDRAARALLGWPRRNSVFPAPIRPAIAAGSREEASRLTQERDGRRVAAQAFGIYAKTHSLDALLALHLDARDRIREVHPEVCFWAWNGERAMEQGKKSLEGRAERLRLVSEWLGAAAFESARVAHPKKYVAEDDILDAFAALWTATRVFEGRARALPERPQSDAVGLPMRIVY